MGPESIILTIRDEGDGEGTYSFVCPICREEVEKQADNKVISLLRSAGVCMADGGSSTPPATDQARFTLDDLIRFHFLLQEDAYLDRFLADL